MVDTTKFEGMVHADQIKSLQQGVCAGRKKTRTKKQDSVLPAFYEVNLRFFGCFFFGRWLSWFWSLLRLSCEACSWSLMELCTH